MIFITAGGDQSNFQMVVYDLLQEEWWPPLPALSRLQLASANRVAALTSHEGILWVKGIPDVKKRYRESIENAYYRLSKGFRRDFVIRSVTDVLRTQSRFVKCVGGSACGLTPTNFTNLLWARSTSETDLITNIVVPGNQRHFGTKVATRILSFYCRNFCRRSNQKKCCKHVALELGFSAKIQKKKW